MKITQKNSLFFLCDIQERFRCHIHQYASVVETARKLSVASKILNIPLIATEQNPKGLGRISDEIDIKHAKLFEKTIFSMCTPHVNAYLSDRHGGCKHVVLFGIESHVCVLQTALDLLRRDFQVYVVADGISSMNKEEIQVAIQRMRQAGAYITTSDSILFEILSDASHPEFKQISNLVKEHKSFTLNSLKALL